MTKTILVTAANGIVGSQLVPRLLALGHRVRAASRSGASPLGDAVKLDFANPADYPAALADVDAIYLVVPAGETDPIGLLGALVDAAAAKGIKIVLQSAIGVNSNDAIPMRQLELRIERSGAPFVILRPNWFADNFHNYWRRGIVEEGRIVLPAGEAKTTFIDARDIADAAAAALTDSAFDGRAYDLTGMDSLSYGEAARILSATTGRDITYEAADEETFVAFAPRTGLSSDYARYLVPIFHPVAAGFASADSGDLRTLTGRPARRFVDYAADRGDLLR